jgi:hypothetical protein
MTSRERIEAAIALREPDRVPVAPDFDIYVAAHAGLTMRELLFDVDKAEAAFERAFNDFQWDGNHLFLGGTGPYWRFIFAQEFIMPGVDGVDDDRVPQMLEIEMVGPEVYEEICRDGFFSVMAEAFKEYYPELRSKREVLRILCGFLPFAIKARRHLSKWEKKGVPCLTGTIPGLIAFDVLSGLRSMARFCIDLHRYPDLVLRALAVTNRFYIEMMVKGAKAVGSRFAFIGSARPSATFISPEYFERFALPLFVEATERMVEEGLTPFLHFDSDWTPMLPYLKELPRRKCILDLDGTTDIFKAKEVLGDHMCIMGDVPAALLTLGGPEEVDAYCERLIKEVGAGGGFILSSGCSTPPEARPENVKVMVESVKKYKP